MIATKYNNRQIKLTYPNGTIKIKPYASPWVRNDKRHLKDAKEAYALLIKESNVQITLF